MVFSQFWSEIGSDFFDWSEIGNNKTSLILVSNKVRIPKRGKTTSTKRFNPPYPPPPPSAPDFLVLSVEKDRLQHSNIGQALHSGPECSETIQLIQGQCEVRFSLIAFQRGLLSISCVLRFTPVKSREIKTPR